MDDMRFIQGINEVRWKIFENANTIKSIVDNSDLNQEQKDIIKGNVDIIADDAISIGDVIELTFTMNSPLSLKSVIVDYDEEGNKIQKIKGIE